MKLPADGREVSFYSAAAFLLKKSLNFLVVSIVFFQFLYKFICLEQRFGCNWPGKFCQIWRGYVLSGAVLGGIGSSLVGGNFWECALIGGVVAGLNHVAHSISEPSVDKDTRRTFRKLVRNDDYQGAFDLVNSKYNLDAGIEGKYTLTFSDDYSYSGLTGGEAYGMQEVTIAKHVFRGPVATFARVVHHEFVHVYQRAILGMTGNLSIYQVREFLGYHDSLFNKNLPKASFSSMEGYWNKAR